MSWRCAAACLVIKHATPPRFYGGVDSVSGMALATGDLRQKWRETPAASAVPLTKEFLCS